MMPYCIRNSPEETLNQVTTADCLRHSTLYILSMSQTLKSMVTSRYYYLLLIMTSV